MQAIAAQTSQVNTRVDSAVKAQAEAVLELMGSSTAKLVRSVFAKVASGAQSYEELASVLEPERPAGTDALLEEGWAIANAFYRSIGAADAPATDSRPWDEVYAEAMEDHFAEKGVIR